MLLDLTDAASALAPMLTALRRAIHLEPELGLHTPKTSAKVRAALVHLPLAWREGPSTTGLVATLDHYRRGEAETQVPIWRMIATPLSALRTTAERWAAVTGGTVVEGQSAVGGGSLPGETLPTALLALDVSSADAFAANLRVATIPIIARISEGRVLFDPRTVLAGQEDTLLAGIAEAWNMHMGKT